MGNSKTSETALIRCYNQCCFRDPKAPVFIPGNYSRHLTEWWPSPGWARRRLDSHNKVKGGVTSLITITYCGTLQYMRLATTTSYGTLQYMRLATVTSCAAQKPVVRPSRFAPSNRWSDKRPFWKYSPKYLLFCVITPFFGLIYPKVRFSSFQLSS